MDEQLSPIVKEGWTGPGRRDGKILPMRHEENALHIEVGAKNQFEWWYFDAHLEGGYTLVAFFYAAYPNPGLDLGKVAVELTLLRPDGRKTQKVIKYKKSQFYAERNPMLPLETTRWKQNYLMMVFQFTRSSLKMKISCST